ncbi:PEGA domain protein [Emticicia oligotrophica DSM 17448]|uniref:PEGA domain protein n=1 Tax=Emticicia oligotrophica (strain DSM 17448 / CIP 109782 / MTCC 6937 / GPTSA100-15) TaxID=929562 RepID=A0ABM5N5C7_EMTOG|nr:PEGA domain-containing protein [Emticicia oligotrophica]AFK04651.1 PEGA domain protein [Emticicia oligotrophica DSM 17448]
MDKLIKKTILSLLTLFSFGALVSCASIIHGKIQDIVVSSQPSGAKIFIDGKEFGQTPKVLGLPRNGRFEGEPSTKQGYKISITMEGYQPYETILQRKVDGWFFGNIILGGVIGIVIDAVTGSMYKLTPNQVSAQMKLSGANVFNYNKKEVYIATTLQPD